MTTCASCGTLLEPREGSGRPSTYCTEACRRLAEFRIRSLVRRIDRTEDELREVLAKCGRGQYLDATERTARARRLRRWLTEDEARLAALLGVKPAEAAAVESKPAKARRR